MRIFVNKFQIRIACFLVAFVLIGAGFAFLARRTEIRFLRRERAYEELTSLDGSENLTNLADSLKKLLLVTENERTLCLSDIRAFALLAESALGYTELGGSGGRLLFEFLSGVAEIAQNAIACGVAPEGDSVRPNKLDFKILSGYADRIVKYALPFFSTDKKAFRDELLQIFSDTGIQTLFYENGIGKSFQGDGFSTIGGANIDEKEALKTARKYLGAKSQLKARKADGSIPAYNIEGKNISAVVSAKSGYLMQFLFDLPKGEYKIEPDAARAKVIAFLSEMGFDKDKGDLSETACTEGIYIFEYVPISTRDIVCQSEKIIVGISWESGRVCLYDATNYYRYHSKSLVVPEGILGAAEIGEKYGMSALPQLFKIERANGVESFCYLIKKDDYEFFVSALSGQII